MIAVVLAEVSEGGMDPRVLAVLGVLSAVNALLRGLSPGTAGVELVFFLLILAGRVFGPGLRLRARLHVAVRLGADDRGRRAVAAVPDARLGLGRDGRRAAAAAGHRPRRDRDAGAYGVVAAYAFGLLMNLSSWPFAARHRGARPRGLAVLRRRARRCWRTCTGSRVYTLLTSTGSWDTGRAITNAVAIVVLGPAVLTTLRRAARRATVTGTSRPEP